MPRGRGLTAAALVTQLGVLGLTAALWEGSRLVAVGALIFFVGCGLFLRQVAWMLAHPKPPPRELRRPDLGRWHLAAAFGYLAVAGGLAAAILAFPRSPLRVALLTFYGVALLVGFLSQMVVGISVRILPLYAWLRDFAAGDFTSVPRSPHQRPARVAHHLTFWGWSLATPLLGFGLAGGDTGTTRLAGALLALAAASSLAQTGYLLRDA
jgi:hypothetical protein